MILSHRSGFLMRSTIQAKMMALVACTALACSVGCSSTSDPDEAEDLALSASEYEGSGGTDADRLTAENNAAEQDFSGQPAPVTSTEAEPLAEVTGGPAPTTEETPATGMDPSTAADAGAGSDPGSVSGSIETVPVADETNAGDAAVTASTDPAGPSDSVDAAAGAGASSSSSSDPFPAPESESAVMATEELASESPQEPATIASASEILETSPKSEMSETPQTPETSVTQEPLSAADSQPLADIPPAPPSLPDPAPSNDPLPSDTAVAEAPSSPRPKDSKVPRRARAQRESTASASSMSVASETLEYLVAPGDSVSEIASRIYGSAREWQTIARANGLQAPYVIYPGDVLKIKVLGTASAFAQAYKSAPETQITVQKGDTLSSISERLLGTPNAWKYIWKINETDIPNPNALRPGQVIRFRDYRGIQAKL